MSRSEESQAQPETPPPGAELRAAREARDMSVSEVAARLHLHERMVEALESNDESRMPTPIFARGYLRNYARLTGLDPDAIVAAYDRLGQEGPELRPPARPPGQASSSDKAVKAMTYLLSLGLVLLLVAWWQSRNMEDDSLMNMDTWQASSRDGSVPGQGAGTDTPTAEQPVTGQTGSEQTVRVEGLDYPLQIVKHPDSPFYPPAGKVEPSGGSVTAESGATGPDGEIAESNTTGAAEPAIDPAETNTAAESDTPGSVTTQDTENTGAETTSARDSGTTATTTDPDNDAASAGSDGAGNNPPTLQLDLNADSWIEIYDAEGERVYMGLGRADESLTFNGELPLEIVLGYAPGVEVTFRGRNIDTGRHSRAGVARFTVGE